MKRTVSILAMVVYLRWAKSLAVVTGSIVVIVVPALVEIVVSLAESKQIINFLVYLKYLPQNFT